jgi:hypothetical protein
MSDITVGVIIGALLVFFLQWAGKHVLDRLVLPRVLDWWATLSKQMALNRAAMLLKTFELDLKLATNIPLFLLRIEKRQYHWESIPRTINVLLILAIFAHLTIPEQQPPPDPTKLVIAVILVISLSIVSMFLENRRDYLVLSDLINYRDRTITRLEALFKAAGLDENEIRERIGRVPSVPL